MDGNEERFEEICAEFSEFAGKLDIDDLTFIPVSALNGDNIVTHSPNTPWYEGSTLLHHLEHVYTGSDRNFIDARFPVQYVIRPMSHDYHDYRGYAGEVASGTFRPGDEVLVLPSGFTSRIAGIDMYEESLSEAFPPMSVSIRLEDEIDISRGDMICRPNNLPTTTQDIDAMVCWFNERPLQEGNIYSIKHTSRSVRAKVSTLNYRLNVNTLHREEGQSKLEMNEIGRISLRTTAPLFLDEYRRNRTTGSLIIIDEATSETVGAAMVLGTAATPKSKDVVWHDDGVGRSERWATFDGWGATVWCTGLSGSGKSTLAALVAQILTARQTPNYVLDGDNLRHGLNGDLGFSPTDRTENVRRVAETARLFADAGMVTLVPVISPYRSGRDHARALHEAANLVFIEVFIDAPLEVCENRDPKGLYAKARAGELPGFTGIDDPYEAPLNPELVIDSAQIAPVDGAKMIVEALVAAGLPPVAKRN